MESTNRSKVCHRAIDPIQRNRGANPGGWGRDPQILGRGHEGNRGGCGSRGRVVKYISYHVQGYMFETSKVVTFAMKSNLE